MIDIKLELENNKAPNLVASAIQSELGDVRLTEVESVALTVLSNHTQSSAYGLHTGNRAFLLELLSPQGKGDPRSQWRAIIAGLRAGFGIHD